MTETASTEQGPAEGAEPEVLIEQQGALIVLTLNRPRALNALNDAMRAAIAAVLPGYMRDPGIYAVVIRSGSDRAFCAGGDVRELSALAKRDLTAGRQSLAKEYRLNWQLDCFNKPTISLLDGVCIGSGVGLTLYNTHRVAGENYGFSMPETGIGLFPDLGVCATLAKLPDEIGTYLALTGRRIGRADAYALGLATHCIPAGEFPAIVSALADAEPVDPLLDSRHIPPGPPPIDAQRSAIREAFAAGTMEEIMARLAIFAAGTGSEAAFCRDVQTELGARSPLSLKITLRHLRAAAAMDLKSTLEMDHRLASHCLAASDFHEGVRAVLVDKDQTPHWEPSRLEDIGAGLVERYFARFDDQDLVLEGREHMT